MQKITIKVPIELKYFIKKLFLLLIRIKNFLILLIIFFFLTISYNESHKKFYNSKKGSSYNINNPNNIKLGICTLGKNENKYIKEFITHYKELGVDKIFLHDNNDIGFKNESFEDVISDYIKDDFVEIINYRGKRAPQFKIYTECYKKNNKFYDWLIFFDIDEFIYLQNYSNIKDFLSEKKFSKCKLIYFNCFRHTDNDLLYYDNRSLSTRFPDINWKSYSFTLKTIARGNITNIKFRTSHWLDRRIKGCNVFGELVIPSRKVKLDNNINDPKFKRYYIDHYCFKSTEEYINKINKGDGIFGFNNRTRMHKIRLYFDYNRISLEKINYLEKKTGLDLTIFRNKLNKNNYKIKHYLNSSLNKKLIFYIIFLIFTYPKNKKAIFLRIVIHYK